MVYLRTEDQLVVWKVDRLGRSLREMLDTAHKLQEQGDAVGCLRILESYWPRFVDDQFGLAPPNTLESARAPDDSANDTNRLK